MAFSFVRAAAKHLRAVEITDASNQHEFNGIAGLREIFGTKRQSFKAKFSYCGDNGVVITEDVEVTWYNAREVSPTRNEYRFYYTGNEIVNRAEINDLLVVGKNSDDEVSVLVVKKGCETYRAFVSLFGLMENEAEYTVGYNIAI